MEILQVNQIGGESLSKFKMSIRYPSGNGGQAIEYMSLAFREEIEPEDLYLEFIGIWIIFEAMKLNPGNEQTEESLGLEMRRKQHWEDQLGANQ